MSGLVYVPEVIERPSPNHSPRKAGVRVDTVLIHHTATKANAVGDAAALWWLADQASGVSAHYVVSTWGVVYRLVPEDRSAWHAGVAHLPWEKGPWSVRGKLTNEGYGWFNSRSIGIEVVNPGDGKTPFTEKQYRALEWLVPDIVRRLSWGTWTCSAGGGKSWTGNVPYIPERGGLVGHVLGHRDVAPGRKTDPADNFDWGRIRAALAGGVA